MNNIGYIYSLSCPITGAPKYIGQTVRTPLKRFNAHMLVKKANNKRTSWLLSLKNNGLLPVMDVLEEVSVQELNFWEKHYISLYRSWGFELKNATMGGDGTLGHKLSDEAKIKIGNANRGKVRSDEVKEKMRLYRINITEETRQKMSVIRKGQKLSPEYILKIKEGWKNMSPEKKASYIEKKKNYRHSDDTKIKISKANKGKHSNNKGKKFSEEHRNKIRMALKGRKLPEWQKVLIGNANRGRVVSDETRKKISLANMGRIGSRNWLGKKHSEETKKKISLGNKGKVSTLKGIKRSEEFKAKLRAANIGKKLSPEHIQKLKDAKANMSDETRLKMSLAKKGKPTWNKGVFGYKNKKNKPNE